VLLQNKDDRTLLIRRAYGKANASMIRGSGIDFDHFQPFPAEDRPIVTAAFVGRIIEIKGVRVLMNIRGCGKKAFGEDTENGNGNGNQGRE